MYPPRAAHTNASLRSRLGSSAHPRACLPGYRHRVEDPARSVPRETLPVSPADVAVADALTDEEAARSARERYRTEGLPNLAADHVVGPLLAESERVLDWRAQAGLSRVSEQTRAVARHDGPLYITRERLVHLGESMTSVPLTEIEELAMADDRILVTISNSRGLMLDVEGPRQLRVLLAAARTAHRPLT